MTEDLIIEVNDNDFEETIREGVTLVDYFAEWCGPCRMLTPVLQKVAIELQGKVKFVKLDIDKNQVIAKNHSVTSVPTLILFKDAKRLIV